MRVNVLYANVSKCIFCAEEISFQDFSLISSALRADPAKVKATVDWSIPKIQIDLRKWLGLANYLYKYIENYADTTRPLTDPFKEDADGS